MYIIDSLKPKKPRVGCYFREKIRNKRVYLTSTYMYEQIKAIDAIKWMKHQKKIISNQVEFINENYMLSLNWHFYKNELVKSGKAALIDEYNLDQAIYSQDELKELSNYAFYNGIKDYEYIVGIDTLYGWMKDTDDEVIIEKIGAWVNNDFKPNYQGDENRFNVKFRECIRKTLHWKEQKLKMTTTARIFVIIFRFREQQGQLMIP